MASESVQPLRINKSPPGKMNGSGIPRPLSEISPMAIRRNSPSFNNRRDSSPFENSPASNNSPRNFWKTKDHYSPTRSGSENTFSRHGSTSPARRPSLEKLKNASRVKNSSMFAREHDSDYDPDVSSVVERPLAGGRPLSQMQGNAWVGNRASGQGYHVSENKSKIPQLQPSPAKSISPSKDQPSPQKSSLAYNSRFVQSSTFDPEEGTWSEDETTMHSAGADTPRASLRQPKSVSFDAAPPQINEYEMITPDPSSVASGSREGSYDSEDEDISDSFERDGSFERDDSFDESLEDADKTPVVLPEDWRFMSPEAANIGLARSFDDPFEGPQNFSSPSARYRATPERELNVARTSSVNSNGEQRPLPPVPAGQSGHKRESSKDSLSRPQLSQHTPPRPASLTKADVLGMRANAMPLEERLRLMSLGFNKPESEKTELLAGEETKAKNDAETIGDCIVETPNSACEPPPRVSRESILRKVRSQTFDEINGGESSPATVNGTNADEIDYSNLDPDVPIPSTEVSSTYSDDKDSVPIKTESDEDSLVDLYSFAEYDEPLPSTSHLDGANFGDQSVIHHDVSVSDISEELVAAHEEQHMPEENGELTDRGPSPIHDDGIETPKTIEGEQSNTKTDSDESNRMSLPAFTTFGSENFGIGLETYMTPSPPHETVVGNKPEIDVLPPSEPEPVKRPSTPDHVMSPSESFFQNFEEDVGTPDSVIHNPTEDAEDDGSRETETVDEDEMIAATMPEVPEPAATIKSSGSKLKTRLSSTPADLQAMAATRRHVSREQPPSISENTLEDSQGSQERRESGDDSSIQQESLDPSFNRRQSLKMKLDVPLQGFGDELGMGLGEEFNRLLEAKKKGYLMRQNTKVVVATTRQASGESKTSETSDNNNVKENTTKKQTTDVRGTKSAGNSPTKTTGKTWTTEPWNGKMRRHSTRKSNIVPEKRISLGPVPPLPGQSSNVTDALDAVVEDELSMTDDSDGTIERGRVFVKVIGVKDLDLPLPRNERCHFQMTLDNGLHCVTTPWSELGKTAPIGQEFELVVFDDLEFQLTLQTKLDRPTSAMSTNSSSASVKEARKPFAFSRMFASPKKRREQEKRQREQEEQAALQRQREFEAQHANRQPTAWDLQHHLVGPDGSFARAYVCLSNHERQSYGRPLSVDVPCWNEWAVEDKSGQSTRSKMGGVQRKPPYRIGKMELQLMYIPRPKDSTDEDMPKSMSAAIRQIKETEATVTRQFEGHLSQQGGDCPYWRRRFFKLNGSKLTAYHDTTRQPRATISLAKAVKLIDDKTSLTQTDPTSSPAKGKGRRKSAFAEDEEGYMFVEEGFRIRFLNGEVIDFYADNRQQKDEWMRVLSEAVGRESPEEKKTWTSLVLARERASAAKTANDAQGLRSKNTKITIPQSNSKSAPTSPKKDSPTKSAATVGTARIEHKPPPIEKSPRHSITTNQAKSKQSSPSKQTSPLKDRVSPGKRNSAANALSQTRSQEKGVTGKRQAVRSMVF